MGRSSNYSKRGKVYPRTARLNSLLQEIIAEEFELIDDEEMGFITVTGVEVDNDLNVAKVYVSSLEERTEELLEKIYEHRGKIKSAIASQTKLRKTPDVVFMFDPSVEYGERIDDILNEIKKND